MRRWVAAIGACALLAAACDAGPTTTRGGPRPIAQSTSTAARPSTVARSPRITTLPLPRTTTSPLPPLASVSSVALATGEKATTPRRPGIVGHQRVVAYYGVPGNSQLGVLGSGSAEQIARAVTKRAAAFRGYGEPVRPALELIATVAQASPGRDRTYSKMIAAQEIRSYLGVVHRHHLLLILDLQPGRASFIAQAERMRPFLLDPSVQLALDPEWKVASGAPGGGRIGSTSAQSINVVGRYLSDLVRAHHLPPKMLLVHQFKLSMLPDRSRIVQHTGVQMVLHADGFGTQAQKIKVFRALAFPHPPFGVGLKLFLRHDTNMMSARQVMALRPRPDVVTYQ